MSACYLPLNETGINRNAEKNTAGMGLRSKKEKNGILLYEVIVHFSRLIKLNIKFMKVTLLALTGLLAAASFCACDNNNDNEDTNSIVNATDSAFVIQAGMSNTAEISVAQLTPTRSIDSSIMTFAQQMINDHTAAQTSLKNVAGKYYLTVPDSVEAAHALLKAQLELMSGRAFDSMYIHQQVTDHQAAIQLYQTEVNSGNNLDLRNFADTTLPKLQMHLNMADSIASKY
jgi:putative membrane protein